MKKANLREIAAKIAALMNCESSGSCGFFAAWVTKIALAHDITDFKIVCGKVQCRANGNWQEEHIWIEDSKGKIDPTVAQFDPYFVGYVGGYRKKFPPEEFIVIGQPRLKSAIQSHLRKTPAHA